jgi:hypothetical protein
LTAGSESADAPSAFDVGDVTAFAGELIGSVLAVPLPLFSFTPPSTNSNKNSF